jgi:Tfp pilus assembly protein PilW
MKPLSLRGMQGFTLLEMLMATACSSFMLGAILTAGVALQRSFAAVESYSIAEGDQLRVLDYISMDCRRSLSASIASNVLTLTVPVFYDSTSSNAPYRPTLTSGAVSYGSGSITITYSKSGFNFNRTVTVKNAAGTTTSTSTTAIARNVAAFTVTPVDLTSSLSCNIMFFPTFKYTSGSGSWRSGSTAPDNSVGADGDLYVVDPTASDPNTIGDVYRRTSGSYVLLQNVKATTVYCNTFLRNAGARQ